MRRRERQGSVGRFQCQPFGSGFARRCGQPRSSAGSQARIPEISRLYAAAGAGSSGCCRKSYCFSFRSVVEWAIVDMRHDIPCDRESLCRRAIEIHDARGALAEGCGPVLPKRSPRPVGLSTLPKMIQHHMIAAVAHVSARRSGTRPRRRRTIRAFSLRLRRLTRSRKGSRLLRPGWICSTRNCGCWRTGRGPVGAPS